MLIIYVLISDKTEPSFWAGSLPLDGYGRVVDVCSESATNNPLESPSLQYHERIIIQVSRALEANCKGPNNRL